MIAHLRSPSGDLYVRAGAIARVRELVAFDVANGAVVERIVFHSAEEASQDPGEAAKDGFAHRTEVASR